MAFAGATHGAPAARRRPARSRSVNFRQRDTGMVASSLVLTSESETQLFRVPPPKQKTAKRTWRTHAARPK